VPVSLNGEEVKARDGADGGMEGRGVGVHACIWERKAVTAGWAVLRPSGRVRGGKEARREAVDL